MNMYEPLEIYSQVYINLQKVAYSNIGVYI
jgi:hypothetical protein